MHQILACVSYISREQLQGLHIVDKKFQTNIQEDNNKKGRFLKKIYLLLSSQTWTVATTDVQFFEHETKIILKLKQFELPQ